MQLAQPGSYVLRDALSPLFRCFVTVAAGQQGRAVMPAPDGSFRTTGLADGDYTLRVWFEGRALAETTAHVANGHDVSVPAINVNAPPGAAGTPAAGAPAAGAPAAGAPAAGAPAASGGESEGHAHHHHHGGR
jgi:adenosylcobyric acid synthase